LTIMLRRAELTAAPFEFNFPANFNLHVTALPILVREPGIVRLIVEVYFAGVQNITALGNLITWQKVEYDFDFHKQDFPCNILALVLSEGKSILKVTLNGFLVHIYL